MAGHSKLFDPSSIPLRPKVGSNVWKHLAKIARIAFFVTIFAAIFTLFLPVIRTMQRLQEAKRESEAKTALEIATYQKNKTEYDLIRTNPDYVERVARDTLNLGKPGETIFRFDSYKDPATAQIRR